MRLLSRAMIVVALVALILAPAGVAAAATFSDDFTSGPLDTSAWQVLLPWGTQYSSNHEQQWYDPANVTFLNGGVRLTTERRTVNGWPYASGLLTSKTRYSYGYYEIRAKLPKGQGVWPAFWLLADGTHEIDVFELLGNQPNKVYMTYHRGDSQVYQSQYTGPDFSAGYHTFAVDWQPSCIRWYIDGVKRGEYTGTVLSTPQNIILNTAVGGSGSWPGAPDPSTTMPQYFDIDYVHVYPTKPAATEPVPPAPAPEPTQTVGSVTYARVQGGDRFATAVALSKRAFPRTAPAVVLAYGGNYPDALASAPLAKAYGGPVLLTQTAALRSDVLAELKRLAPKQVFIAGSTSVVSANVAAQLRGLPSAPVVTRLGGIDRYATAALIADAVSSKVGHPSKVVLVSGTDFRAGLCAAPLAAAKGWPILLTRTTSMPAATADAIGRIAPAETLVVGPTGAVSEAVTAMLPLPQRLGGSDPSVSIAAYAKDHGQQVAHVALATDGRFPDGLVAAPYLAADDGLLMLTPGTSLTPAVGSELTADKSTIRRVDVLGTTAAVSEATVQQAVTALR